VALVSLVYEQITYLQHHGGSPLLGRLDLHEAHRWTASCFADGLRIAGIVLATLHLRLDVAGRHEAHLMAKPYDFRPPEVSTTVRLHPDRRDGSLKQNVNTCEPRSGRIITTAPSDEIACPRKICLARSKPTMWI
jgi:hypothetical protein